MAARVLKEVAIIPAPTIEAGFTLPYWLRYAITFMGISWSEEIFRIKKEHISLLANPFLRTGPGKRPILRSSSKCASSSIAFSPAGVAAHPSPRIFAIILVVIWSIEGWFEGRSGNKKRIKGSNFLEADLIIPDLAAISIIPTQNDIIPIIVMHRVIASLEASTAALVISGIRPVKAAYMIPIRIIPAQR